MRDEAWSTGLLFLQRRSALDGQAQRGQLAAQSSPADAEDLRRLGQVIVRVSKHLKEEVSLGDRLKLRVEVRGVRVQPVLDDARQIGEGGRLRVCLRRTGMRI